MRRDVVDHGEPTARPHADRPGGLALQVRDVVPHPDRRGPRGRDRGELSMDVVGVTGLVVDRLRDPAEVLRGCDAPDLPDLDVGVHDAGRQADPRHADLRGGPEALRREGRLGLVGLLRVREHEGPEAHPRGPEDLVHVFEHARGPLWREPVDPGEVRHVDERVRLPAEEGTPRPRQDRDARLEPRPLEVEHDAEQLARVHAEARRAAGMNVVVSRRPRRYFRPPLRTPLYRCPLRKGRGGKSTCLRNVTL